MRGRPGMGFLTGAPVQFQSTPPCGGDNSYPLFIADIMISIHAPMRGRPLKLIRAAGWNDFNPRPHAGATKRPEPGHHVASISIHAPMRGRPLSSRTKTVSMDFNPRPHAGATLGKWHPQPDPGDFNPRPHAGATPAGGRNHRPQGHFNPRPHAGATTRLTRSGRQTGFQSTPPCGGD